MGFFNRLFGSGKVRALVTFSDKSELICKVPYEGAYNEGQMKQIIADQAMYQLGKRPVKIVIELHLPN